ncbi:unnamed protein product [Caenorhabditis brenneri]
MGLIFGFEAKVVNLTAYVIFHICFDMTHVQMTIKGNRAEPDTSTILLFGSIFVTILIGSILSTVLMAAGAHILILSQLGAIFKIIYYVTYPQIRRIIIDYWYNSNNFCLDFGCWHVILRGLWCGFLCTCLVAPVFVIIWFIYCAYTMGRVLNGHKVFATRPQFSPERGFYMIPVDEPEGEQASTISVSSQSTPVETDYFSDVSSN